MLGRIVSDLTPNTARQRVIVLCILSTLISVVFIAACAGTKTELDFTSAQSLSTAAFQLSRLKINPTEVTSGKRVLIDVDLTNTGDIEGNHTVELKINNVVLVTKDVTVPPSETWRLTFSGPTETQGIYEVTVGELTEQYVVRDLILSSPDPAAKPSPYAAARRARNSISNAPARSNTPTTPNAPSCCSQ